MRFFSRSKVSTGLLFVTLLGTFVMVYVHSSYADTTGDWPTYLDDNSRSGFNSAETIINPTTAPQLKLHWTDHDGNPGAVISTQPVEANGLIYWGSWDGLEHATNLSGTDVWVRKLGTTSACHSKRGVAGTATITSIVINGTATSVDFVGGGNGQFFALNAQTGAVIWNTLIATPPSQFLWSSPLVYNGSVYEGVASYDDCPVVQGLLVQMNATTGAIQNTFDVVPTGCIGGAVWGSPTVDTTDSTLYFATGNPGTCSTAEPYAPAIVKVNASDLSFVSSWQVPANRQIPDSDFGTTPTLFQATINGVVQPLVGVVNKNGTYYTFERSNISGGPIWTAHIGFGGDSPPKGRGPISPSAWDGSTLYVAGEATTINGVSCPGSVGALNPATGAYLWQDCLSGAVLDAVTAVPGVAVVGAGSNLEVVATASGQTLFTYADITTGALIFGAASISNGVLYIGDTKGNLFAFGL